MISSRPERLSTMTQQKFLIGETFRKKISAQDLSMLNTFVEGTFI